MSYIAPLIDAALTWFAGLGLIKQVIALGTLLVGGYYYALMVVSGCISWAVETIQHPAMRHLVMAAIAVLFGYEWVVSGITDFV